MAKVKDSVITEKIDKTEKTEKKDRFKVLRIIKNVILGTLIAFFTLVLITSMIARFTGSSPSLFGHSLYRVSSGSMRPELEVGDVILVKNFDGKQAQEKDIVTYVAQSGEMKGLLITHRVIKAPYQHGDEYYVVTKGDANDTADDPVNVSQIQGKMLFKIGILKYLFDFFVTPWGLLAIIALIILAFSNEIVIFVKSIFGIGFEEKTNVEEIIERYQKENMKKLREEAEKSKESEKSDEPADNTEGGAE